uniref:CAZy families GH23 protein n=1 Tax=uncultured Pseudomonas sp. TaxID=114707 RepID=A0A060BY36_9PSED|nr:CAZy families GH23 protein [uncultured Pseudomonas sp.]
MVEHGVAPFEYNPENRESYYVTLERGGERHTVWGVDLERAIAEAGSQAGERIGLEGHGFRAGAAAGRDGGRAAYLAGAECRRAGA